MTQRALGKSLHAAGQRKFAIADVNQCSKEFRYFDVPKLWTPAGAATAVACEEPRAWLGSYEAIAAGELDTVSHTVLQFTGDHPLSLSQYFRKHPEFLNKLR
jgi:hypothetical protein